MSDRPQVGVRYCGGCNPRFNRVQLVKRLEKALSEIEFVPAEDGVPYAAVLLVHGCTNRCTTVSGLAVPEARQVPLSGDTDFVPAQKKLKELVFGGEARSLTHEEVLNVLPHRDPMLLIDEVSRLVPGSEAVATFFVRPDWDIFRGHFPGQPVLPGVYSLEAMAQCAGLLLLSLERYAGKAPSSPGPTASPSAVPSAPGTRWSSTPACSVSAQTSASPSARAGLSSTALSAPRRRSPWPCADPPHPGEPSPFGIIEKSIM